MSVIVGSYSLYFPNGSTVTRYFQIDEIMQKTPNEIYYWLTELNTIYHKD
jgi:hypothetical protein